MPSTDRAKHKHRPHIVNSKLDGMPEISIRFDIEDYDGDYIANQIDNFEDKEFRIKINSFGGNIMGAYSIVSAMQRFMNAGGIVETVNEGRADSSAGWIFSCGTKGRRKVMQFASSFFHAPETNKGEKIEDFEPGSEIRERMEKAFENLINILVSCTGNSKTVIKNLMESEIELQAKDLVKKGFADEIIEVNNAPKFKNHISAYDFVNLTSNLDFDIINNPPSTGVNTKKSMREVCTLLNLNTEANESAIRAEVKKLIDGLANKNVAVQNLTQELSEVRTERDRLKAEIKKLRDQEAIDYVNQLCSEDQTKEPHKATLVNFYKQDPEAFKAMNPVSGIAQIDKGIDPAPKGDPKKDAELEHAREFNNMNLSQREELKNSDYDKYLVLVNAYDKRSVDIF